MACISLPFRCEHAHRHFYRPTLMAWAIAVTLCLNPDWHLAIAQAPSWYLTEPSIERSRARHCTTRTTASSATGCGAIWRSPGNQRFDPRSSVIRAACNGRPACIGAHASRSRRTLPQGVSPAGFSRNPQPPGRCGAPSKER